MSSSKDLYEMKLHERLELGDRVSVLRVPGGWVYSIYINNKDGMCESSQFVPYHNEFNNTLLTKSLGPRR